MLLMANAPLVEDALYQFRFNLHDAHGRETPLEVGAHLLWQDAAARLGPALDRLPLHHGAATSTCAAARLDRRAGRPVRVRRGTPTAPSRGLRHESASPDRSHEPRTPCAPTLPALYADPPLTRCKRRADEALQRGGFDALVVPSGRLHYQVFDDRDYPFAVNPQFKAWVPLTRMPGQLAGVRAGPAPEGDLPAAVRLLARRAERAVGRLGRAHRHRDHPHARRSAAAPAEERRALRDPRRAAERARRVRAEQSAGGRRVPGIPARVQDRRTRSR